MQWNIRIDNKAAEQIEKLDKQVVSRIMKFLEQLSSFDNPRMKGEPLTEPRFKGLWRYRVGDYRLLCNIQDNQLVVLVINIEHRGKVYR